MRRAALLLLAAACTRSAPVQASHVPPYEICDNGSDDDGNGAGDCADPACYQDARCPACGDGFLDPREACEHGDLRDASCLSLGYDGGPLFCAADCTLDVSECVRLEKCDVAGDEDGNGLSDCADPACVTEPACRKLLVESVPATAGVSSAFTVLLRVTDAGGHDVEGVDVGILPPPGAFAGPPVPSNLYGLASIDVRLGRLPGDPVLTALLIGTGVSTTFSIHATEAAPGTVLTVVNAAGASGADASGPAVSAALGALVDVQVSSSGELYVAERCRVLLVSPAGELSVLAGDGSCSGAEGGAPLRTGISVAGLVLDEASSVLYLADPAAGLVRALDLGAGTMRTVGGGGSLEGDAAEGQPATSALLRPTAVAAGGGSLHLTDGAGNRIVRVALDTGILTTDLEGAQDPVRDCSSGPVLRDCATRSCRLATEPDGTVFVAGALCSATGGWLWPNEGQGILRLDATGTAVVAMGSPGFYTYYARNMGLTQVPAAVFDPGGNLLLFDGSRLLRLDGVTTGVEELGGFEQGFAGDGGPVAKALFDAPGGLAFGPRGDLYVADTGNGAIRRIVGLGAQQPTPVKLSVVSGDGQKAQLTAAFAEPLSFRVTDPSGRPLASDVMVVARDPGSSVVDDTDGADGKADRNVRAGIVPGPEVFEAYARGLEGRAGGDPAVFTLEAVAPPPGTLVPVAGNGGNTRRPLPYGVVFPGPHSPVLPWEAVGSADGSIYFVSGCQIDRLRPDGGVVAVAGSGKCTASPDGVALDQAGLDVWALALDDAAGVLYFLDASYPDYTTLLRSIDLGPGTLTTIAGGGSTPAGPGVRAADSSLQVASGLALDGRGKLYIPAYGGTGLLRLDLQSGVFDDFLAAEPCPGGTPLSDATSVVASGDAVYVASRTCGGGSFEGSLQADGTLALIGSDPSDAIGVDGQGRPIWSDAWGRLVRYEPSVGAASFTDFGIYPRSFALTRDGRIVVSTSGGNPLQVIW